jgi:hypothetical protein
MRKRKINPKNMQKVFNKLVDFLKANNPCAKKFCKDFNKFLDERLCMDFFGTEGQCDPRGDHRND